MSGPLDGLAARHRIAGWRWAGRLIVLVVGAFALWAWLTPLEEVAVAEGEVVPQGDARRIQHLEGGLIEAILVAEGESVRAGTPLVRVKLGAGAVNRRELQVRLDGQLLQHARHRAEAEGGPLTSDAALQARQPALVAAEQAALAARRDSLAKAVAVQQQKIAQRSLALKEAKTALSALQADLKLAREKLRISADLRKDGLTSKLDHLDRQADVKRLQGDATTLRASLPRLEAERDEARRRAEELQAEFVAQAREALGKLDLAIARTRELLVTARDQAGRTEIAAPIDGVVQKLAVNTIGGVIAPGAVLMEIVPTAERLVVEARLRPEDRGFVQPGQAATVKVSSYDFARYGGLDGAVVRVAADVTNPPDGPPFFQVVVETDKAWLGPAAGLLPIAPGMQATVDIRTGNRTVADYLITPVLKLRDEAFRER